MGAFVIDPSMNTVPVARRLQAPSWRDRRLVVGVVLVLGSIALGVAVIDRADVTEPVYVAGHVLMPGQQLSAGDVQVVRVRLGPQQRRYLSARRALPTGAVVIRSVQSGELVPTSAIGDRQSVSVRPVAVPVTAGSADGLHPGTLVDVWVAAKASTTGAFDPPQVVVSGAEVVSVSGGEGVLAEARDVTVRLLLSDDVVATMLSAVDNSARIDLVPVPGAQP